MPKLTELNESLWRKYVSKDAFSIRHNTNPSPELQLLAAKRNLNSIYYIKHFDNNLMSYISDNMPMIIQVASQSYIAIEFSDKDMIVLESFYYGNSYFVFYDTPVNKLLQIIEGKNKSEVFEMSGMEKRGYHIREALKLELSVKSYFLGR